MVYVDYPEDTGDWMSYAQNHSSCAGFYAVVTQGNTEYTFVGTIQRAFGTGAGRRDHH